MIIDWIGELEGKSLRSRDSRKENSCIDYPVKVLPPVFGGSMTMDCVIRIECKSHVALLIVSFSIKADKQRERALFYAVHVFTVACVRCCCRYELSTAGQM